MRDRFSILAFVSILARSILRCWQRQSGSRRITLISLILAMVLTLSVSLSSLLLDINPYRPAARQVQALLATQPDFDLRLQQLNADKHELLAAIQPTAALDYIHWYDDFTARSADHVSSAASRLAQHLDLLAHTVLRYQYALETLRSADELAILIGDFQNEDIHRQMIALQQIHAISPFLLNEIHEIRRANQLLAVQVNALAQDAGLRAALAELQSAPSGTDGQTLLKAAGQWAPALRTFHSTEIQLANTVSILNQMAQIIQPVHRQDQIWGFSIWIPVAVWAQRHASALILLAVILVLSSVIFLFWQPAISPINRHAWGARLRSLSRHLADAAKPREKNIPATFAQQSGWLVTGLARRAPAAHLNLSRRGPIPHPRLLIPVTAGSPVEKPLPDEGIVRIGNDPAFTVKIPFSGSEYIEFWIQKARRGYFIEVMFSDVQVLHNQHPLSTTRALNHGDQIQIQDTILIFLEH
ncbi:MAG: hypothetical protein ROW48_02450 [Bellilinea sp.]